MTYTVSITSQGQISIPAKFRKKLGLKKYTKAFVTEQDGKLIVEPVKDFLELAGSLKTNKKPLSNKELHDRFGEYLVKEYAKKFKKS